MDESDLKIVESLACVRCRTQAQVTQADDLLRYTCSQDNVRHVLTVRAPGEVEVPADPGDPLAGQTLGPCRVVRRAGSEGGLPLYHGLDVTLNQPHAVRVLAGPGAHDREQLQAFIQAARLAAAVRHAAVATVIHLGRLEAGGLFAVGAPLEGDSFDHAVASGRRFGPHAALRVGRILTEGLALLHDKRIVHRNLGPKSVYLLPNGTPQMRNFAFALGPGATPDPLLVVGQPGYLAPEQAAGGPVDGRADLYALGALLYHALAGRPAFGVGNPADIVRAQLAGAPPDRAPLVHHVPREVADLILALLALKVDDRPANARAVLDVLATAEGTTAPAAAPKAAAAYDAAGISLLDSSAPEPSAPPAASAQAPQGEEAVLPMKNASAKRTREDGSERPRAASAAALEFGARPAAASQQAPGEAGSQRPTAKSPLGTSKPDDEVGLAELILDSEKEGAGAAASHDALADVEVVAPQPIWKRKPRVVLAAAGAVVVVIGAIAAALLLQPAPTPTPPPIVAKNPPPPAGKKVPPKTAAPADKMEADAKAALTKLAADAKAKQPEDVLKASEDFLVRFGATASAVPARKIHDDAQAALLAKTADAKRPEAERALGDQTKPLLVRLAAVDEFLKTYAGTKAAEDLRKRRDDVAATVEAAAKSAVELVQAEVEKQVAAKDFGTAAAKLTDAVAKYVGTSAGTKAAAQLAELQKKLGSLFEEKKKLAEGYVRRFAFTDALALYDDPLKVWKVPDFQKEAERAIAALHQRRADIVKEYGDFLGDFEPRLAEAQFEEALAAAQAAAAKTQDPALKALLDGRVSESELLLRALDRAVAGAKLLIKKAEAEKAAGKGEGKIKIQRTGSGAGFPTLAANPSRKGLTVEMPGLSGEVTWGKLAREQLIEFAQAAPGQIEPADHVALGLLALTGGELKAAYGEFKAAAEDVTAQETILDCLKRNASGLVLVPAGEFLSGPPTASTRKTLEGFLLGRYMVSQIEYAYFLHAVPGREPPPGWKGGQPPHGQEEYPVVNVTWDDARAYADWLGMRLPAALEWERAARGPDGRTFPWGEKFERTKANVAVPPAKVDPKVLPHHPHLVAVNRGNIKDFPLPFWHIVGNAREWTSTPTIDPGPGKQATEYFALGGSAEDIKEEAVRACFDPARAESRALADKRYPFTGFRVAWPR